VLQLIPPGSFGGLSIYAETRVDQELGNGEVSLDASSFGRVPTPWGRSSLPSGVLYE